MGVVVCLGPYQCLQIYPVLSGYALAQVRQRWWGWKIIAAMTVNTSKIKNSDGSNEGNNYDMMLENITHTPGCPGSSIKEQKQIAEEHTGDLFWEKCVSYCLQIVSNSSTNPRFGNKRINCCYVGIFLAIFSIFFWVFQISFKIKAF